MRHIIWSMGEIPHICAPVTTGGAKETVETGCVGAGFSPGTAFCDTGTSVTGRTGLPVRRSSTKISPCLVGCTSAGTARPSTVRSIRLGWAGTS